jgi:hypothetical protein
MGMLRVKEPFACTYRGVEEVFGSGRLVDSKDPVVKGREQFFESVEAASSRMSAGIEAATAAPGEKRSVHPAPAKKAAGK